MVDYEENLGEFGRKVQKKTVDGSHGIFDKYALVHLEGVETVQNAFGVHTKFDGEFISLVRKDGGMMIEKVGRKTFHQKVEAHTFISRHGMMLDFLTRIRNI